jgi:hypothetical protein
LETSQKTGWLDAIDVSTYDGMVQDDIKRMKRLRRKHFYKALRKHGDYYNRVLRERRSPISVGGGTTGGAGRWGCGASGAGLRTTSRTAS